MSTFPFPDEAVEAAARALCAEAHGTSLDFYGPTSLEETARALYRTRAKVMLAAVIPFLGTCKPGFCDWVGDYCSVCGRYEKAETTGGDAAPQQASTARGSESAPAFDGETR